MSGQNENLEKGALLRGCLANQRAPNFIAPLADVTAQRWSQGVFTHTTVEWFTLLYAFFTHVDEEQVRGNRTVSAYWAVLLSSRHLQTYKVKRRRICVKLFKEPRKSSRYPEEVFQVLVLNLRRLGAK